MEYKQLIKWLKAQEKIADYDADEATTPDTVAYYTGMGDAFAEVIGKLTTK